MSASGKTANRRGFLVLGGAALILGGTPALWRRLRPAPGAAPHPHVPGFFQLEQGAVSGAFDPLIGLNDGPSVTPATITDPCKALFRTPAQGRVPVAFFTDINCPYCRVMEPWIRDLDPARVAVTWHDLPLLGEASVAAARAIAAAELQGQDDAMRTRLHRTRFQPEPAYLTALSESLSLDAPHLLADMERPEVTARVANSLGLAGLFGIYGTPALVVGNTLAIGNRDKAGIDTLIANADPGTCS